MEELITTKQVQDLLQVDRITVYRMLKDGRLNGVKVGKQWRFHHAEIEKLLNSGTPPSESQEYAPDQVLPVHCVQAIQNVFAEMNGIGSVTTTLQGEPVTEISNSCDFCRLIHASPTGKQACINSWKKLAGLPEGEIEFFECHAGFQYTGEKIHLHGQPTALQVAGQFFIQLPERGRLDHRIKQLAEEHQIDPSALQDAAQGFRQFSVKQQKQTGEWLKQVAQTFESIAHERADLLRRLKNIADLSTF